MSDNRLADQFLTVIVLINSPINSLKRKWQNWKLLSLTYSDHSQWSTNKFLTGRPPCRGDWFPTNNANYFFLLLHLLSGGRFALLLCTNLCLPGGKRGYGDPSDQRTRCPLLSTELWPVLFRDACKTNAVGLQEVLLANFAGQPWFDVSPTESHILAYYVAAATSNMLFASATEAVRIGDSMEGWSYTLSRLFTGWTSTYQRGPAIYHRAYTSRRPSSH